MRLPMLTKTVLAAATLACGGDAAKFEALRLNVSGDAAVALHPLDEGTWSAEVMDEATECSAYAEGETPYAALTLAVQLMRATMQTED